jgi:S-adenosylmethionine:tRNA ribosyltransferase-isomerase
MPSASSPHEPVTRLLLVDTRTNELAEERATSLPRLLDARDLLVVNDAATLPAALFGVTASGEQVELRLLEGPYQQTTRAVLFGSGDYRTKTEQRPAPPLLALGDVITIGSASLSVSAVSALSPRLVELSWPQGVGDRFALLYRVGRPVQYSYVAEPLALWDVQTPFAARPWAVEMPSAARPLTGSVLLGLASRGVSIATLTHAAGLSASGDEVLDRAFPLPERYEIPAATVHAIECAKARGGRVVAVGTSVVRALEDSALRHGAVRAGTAVAELILDEHTLPRVASGLLTGIHVPGESHYKLLSAFARGSTLSRAAALAERRGYRIHEFGDAALLLPDLLASRRLAA